MPESTKGPLSPIGLILALAAAAGLSMCIALMYLGMQPIMDVGGFVAVGGPYEIAHPAPDWVMLLPLSMMGLFIFGGLNMFTTRKNWGFGLIPLTWVGLFGSAGWSFIRNGLNPPGGDGLAWGWLVSGGTFWLMALVPALFIGSWLIEVAGRTLRREPHPIPAPGGAFSAGWARPAYAAMQAIGIAVGVLAAVRLFSAVTG